MRVRIVLMGLVLIAAACGGGGPATDADTTDDDTAARATADDSSDVARATSDGETPDTPAGDATGVDDTDATEETPAASDGDLPTSLAAFFGYDEEFDQEAAQADFEQQERDLQDAVALCMVREGWEYTPYIPDYGDEVFFGPGEDLTHEEWVQTYGFGISTYFLEEIDRSFEEPLTEYNPEDDPNYVYRETLSPSEQEAYDRALYGNFEFDESDIEYDDEGNEIYPEYEPSGCYDEASQEIYGWGPDSELDQVWQDLEPLYEDLYERIESDPRIVAIQDDWTGCMSEAGYTFRDQEEMYMSIDERMQEFYEAAYGNFDEPLFDDEGNIIDEDGNIIENYEPEPPSLTDEQRADLEELNDYEIGVAVADFECNSGYQEIYQEVSEEYEAEFIQTNIALLTQVRELEGGR